MGRDCGSAPAPEPDFSYDDGAGPCVHRDRGLGDLCAPAGARQERPLGDQRVTPASSADVAIALNADDDCEAEASCTEDGSDAVTELELTVATRSRPSLPAPTNLTAMR